MNFNYVFQRCAEKNNQNGIQKTKNFLFCFMKVLMTLKVIEYVFTLSIMCNSFIPQNS